MLNAMDSATDHVTTFRHQPDDMPFLGVGLGYRTEFRQDLLAEEFPVDFLELMLEHFIDMPPERMRDAELLSERYSIAVHGLELSIGTVEPLRLDYLTRMRDLVAVTGAHWASDHLCMTSVPGRAIGNLTPLPLDRQMAEFITEKCREVVRFLPVPFLLENISVLFRPGPGEVTEQEYIRQILEGSDAYLLLDLTNVFNNAINEGFDAREYLDRLPLDRVVQIHLAGGLSSDGVLLDTHNAAVPAEVFELLHHAAPSMPLLRAVMIERDQDFPTFESLVGELDTIREILRASWAPHFAAGLSAAPVWLGGAAHGR
jgi:uncharacterized protein (UPF0276 family)